MAITELASFMTSDGKVFSSVNEAKAHEMSIEMDGAITEIATNLEVPQRTVSVLKKWMPIFISEMNYVPAPQAVSFEEEANAAGANYPVHEGAEAA